MPQNSLNIPDVQNGFWNRWKKHLCTFCFLLKIILFRSITVIQKYGGGKYISIYIGWT